MMSKLDILAILVSLEGLNTLDTAYVNPSKAPRFEPRKVDHEVPTLRNAVFSQIIISVARTWLDCGDVCEMHL